MATPTSTLGRFFSGLLKIYRVFRAIILNGLFLFMLLLFFGSLIGQPPIVVQPGSALLVNPDGVLVDQLTYVDPLETLLADSLDNDLQQEVLLQDVLEAIDAAATDSNISSLVLMPGNLEASGFSKLKDIADALERFRESGKSIYAYGDNFTQGQYYLASRADEIILNGMGSVNLEGFSSYQLFYKEALEKLGVNVHVFRVGEYKSAVEPFVRSDMSDEAREANAQWLGDLWSIYTHDVTAARDLDAGFLDEHINNLDKRLAEHAGDTSALALDSALVDRLMDRNEAIEYLRTTIGPSLSGDEFLYIGYDSYLTSLRQASGKLSTNRDKVGVIVARGTIFDGRQQAGNIGGDSLQDLIRNAREDSRVKALVLRIDSGGGSAFASEIIRTELEALVAEGKPLVVSMGSVAASGGYWISTPAQEIWASPATITGSIGIFGLYPTFEDTFDKLGLNTDGIGTTELAGSFAIGRGLPPLAENSLQLQLEDGYRRFINLVAESREMTPEDVDRIARGRVWSGTDALENGLVDNLGGLEAALASAANLAGLDEFEPLVIEPALSPGQQFIQDLANSVSAKRLLGSVKSLVTSRNILTGITERVKRDVKGLLEFNDPNGLYLRCQECQAVLSP